MPFINLIKSIKNSFIGKKPHIPAEQNSQTFHQKELPSFERAKRPAPGGPPEHIQRMEKESAANLQTVQTVINNPQGMPTPLLVRIPRKSQGKRRGRSSLPADKDTPSFLFELILETENLGPVLLRLRGGEKLYNCSLYAESREIVSYLCQDFAELQLLLASFLQKTSLGITVLSREDSPQKEHFFINTRV